MIGAACLLMFPQGLTEDMRERLAHRHRMVVISTAHETLDLHGGRANMTGPTDWTESAELAADLHARNCRLTVGIYQGGVASPDSHHAAYEWLEDADLLHANPSQPVVMNPASSPAEPGARRLKVINYQRPETRAKLISCWRAWMAAGGFDAVVFDTYHPEHMAAWIRQAPASPSSAGGFGLTAGGLEGAFHTESWWHTALSLFVSQLRWALAEDGREVWVNGLYDYPNFDPSNPDHALRGRAYTNVSDHATGLLAEYGHVMHRSAAELRGNLEAAGIMRARAGRTFWYIHPGAFVHDPSTSYRVAPGLEAERYYLACYLLMARAGFTLYGYHDGPMYQAYRDVGGQAEPYLYDGGADWDRSYGVPLGGVAWAGDVAYRQYTAGWAVVNAGAGYGYLALPAGSYRDWDATAGALVQLSASSPGFNVPPKSGMFLHRA